MKSDKKHEAFIVQSIPLFGWNAVHCNKQGRSEFSLLVRKRGREMTHSCDRHSCKISLQTFILVKSQLCFHVICGFPFMPRIISALGHKYKFDINCTFPLNIVLHRKSESCCAAHYIYEKKTISGRKKLYLGQKLYLGGKKLYCGGKKLYLGGKWSVESIHWQVRNTLLIGIESYVKSCLV